MSNCYLNIKSRFFVSYVTFERFLSDFWTILKDTESVQTLKIGSASTRNCFRHSESSHLDKNEMKNFDERKIYLLTTFYMVQFHQQ